jgi:hypothetical protein
MKNRNQSAKKRRNPKRNHKPLVLSFLQQYYAVVIAFETVSDVLETGSGLFVRLYIIISIEREDWKEKKNLPKECVSMDPQKPGLERWVHIRIRGERKEKKRGSKKFGRFVFHFSSCSPQVSPQ